MPMQSRTEDEIQALLAAERERCAKVADSALNELQTHWVAHLTAQTIACAIRNLPPQADAPSPVSATSNERD